MFSVFLPYGAGAILAGLLAGSWRGAGASLLSLWLTAALAESLGRMGGVEQPCSAAGDSILWGFNQGKCCSQGDDVGGQLAKKLSQD
jgi:hypothetical protein